MVRFLLRPTVFLLAVYAFFSFFHGASAQSELPQSQTVQFPQARSLPLDPRAGCGVPNRNSLVASSGVHTVTLNHGDVGVCPGDATSRHNAPYWERAMIYSRALPKDGRGYRISGEFRFDPDTSSSGRTTIFQVHQHLTPQCSCYPLIMINIDSDGRFSIESPSLRDEYIHFRVPGWTRERLEREWVEIALDVSTEPGRQTMTVYFGGEAVYQGPTMIREQGQFQPQFGLYRPGNPQGNPTDRLHVRNLRYVEIRLGD